jgi:hypothetical protein
MPSKISDLGQPNLPLVGSELLELSQDSTSVQVTVSELESSVDHNSLAGLQGGDSTTGEFYHVTQAEKDGIFSGSPVIGLGDSAGTNLTVDYGTNEITADIPSGLGSGEVFKLEEYFQTLGDKASGDYIEIEKSDGESPRGIDLVSSSGSMQIGGSLDLNFGAVDIVNPGSSGTDTVVTIGDTPNDHRADVRLKGGPAGDTDGASIIMYGGEDYVSNLQYVDILLVEDDFWISPSPAGNADAIQFDGGLKNWQINAQGDIYLEATGTTRLGASAGTRIIQTSSTIDAYISTTQVIDMDANYQRFGDISNSEFLEFYDGGGETNPTIKIQHGSFGMEMTDTNPSNVLWTMRDFVIAGDAGYDETRLTIGESGVIGGLLRIHGDPTGSADGARILLYPSADYSGKIYFIDVKEDDLIIYYNNNEVTEALKYDAGLQQWIITGPNGVRINNGLNLDGTDVVATADDLNTKEFTVFLEDISAANEISFVSPVDGTCFIVYSSVTGDPGADAIISGNINGGTAFTDTMTVSNGSSQHDVDSMSPTDNNEITAGETVRFVSNGGASNAVGIWLTVVITL